MDMRFVSCNFLRFNQGLHYSGVGGTGINSSGYEYSFKAPDFNRLTIQ